MMGRSLGEKIRALPESQRARVEARAKELIAEEMSLQDLRKAMRLTQVKLAARLGVGQDAVSRAESRTDMLISTLAEHVSAMGGVLDIVARFPDRPPVRLSEIGTISPRKGVSGPTAKTRRKVATTSSRTRSAKSKGAGNR
jgi:DNA-binding XRE family transcriptional regulator